jgi:hypothetical protein
MAKANGNRSSRPTILRDAELRLFVQFQRRLNRLTYDELGALLDRANAPQVDRLLILSVHRLLRTPQRKARTYMLALACIALAPILRLTTRSYRRVRLVLWLHACAKAYLRL